MSSISFDPAAHIYDDFHGYPPGVDRRIALAIQQTALTTGATSFLEVAIGTGRLALPLASLGHTYTGIDISEQMLAQLASKLLARGWQEQKQPWGSLADELAPPAHSVQRFTQTEPLASLRLVISDISTLPFADASFDVAIAMNVFHLVHDWQQAVCEALRVLRPGGIFLHCWDEREHSLLEIVIQAWRDILEDLGDSSTTEPRGAPVQEATSIWLREEGWPVEELCPVAWETTVTPRRALKLISSRLWWRTWFVPNDLFNVSVQRLEAWARDFFGADQLDVPQTRMDRFVIHKTILSSRSMTQTQ
jgi:ubiquinone/menaquinone biosynthesis C-methylase UbiE